MNHLKANRARSITALLAILAMLLLLALGVILIWGTPNVPAAAIGPAQPVGPTEKMAAWIEPPPPAPSPTYERAPQEYRRALAAQALVTQRATMQADLDAAYLEFERAMALQEAATAAEIESKDAPARER